MPTQLTKYLCASVPYSVMLATGRKDMPSFTFPPLSQNSFPVLYSYIVDDNPTSENFNKETIENYINGGILTLLRLPMEVTVTNQTTTTSLGYGYAPYGYGLSGE